MIMGDLTAILPAGEWRSGLPVITRWADHDTNLVIASFIRLRHSGLMAVVDPDGRLVEWTADIRRASLFASEGHAQAAVTGLCAPEIRAAIRSGRAVVEVDEHTGEVMILDARGGGLRPLPNVEIRLAVGPRYIDDDPTENAARAASKRQVTRFVRELFAEARRLNWKLSTKPGMTVARSVSDEYSTPASAKARRAGALAHYTRPRRAA